MENIRNTYVALGLDRSGSMLKYGTRPIDGYNEQVSVLLEDAAKPDSGNTFTSLITFNQKITEEFFNMPINVLEKMTAAQYRPGGDTAYYDAVGYLIEKLCQTTDIDNELNSYLVIVITDGENTVKDGKWDAASLNRRIKELEATNRWTFALTGLKKETAKAQTEMGLYKGNTLDLEETGSGMTNVFLSNAAQMRKYLTTRKKFKSFATQNFYGD